VSEPSLPFLTEGRTITEADIVNFAGFSGDFGPYHVDHAAAGAGIFGAPVMHGLGVLAICSGLIVQSRFLKANGSDPVALLGVDVRMLQPVLAGDTMRVRVRDVNQRRSASRPGCFVCRLALDCVNQRSDVVLEIVWASLQRGPLLDDQDDAVGTG
jgi:acyl dehydratase